MLDSALEVHNVCKNITSLTVSILIMLDSALEDLKPHAEKDFFAWGFNPNYAG